MAEANLHKDLELSSSRSDSSSEKDSRLEPSSDEGIFDDENKDESKEENVKTEEEEKDEDVKSFCEEKLKEVKNELAVEYESLIEMRDAADQNLPILGSLLQWRWQ